MICACHGKGFFRVLISPDTTEGTLAGTRCLPSDARIRIRILATTDLHMNLTSHNYFSDRPDPTVGLTRTATLIRQARVEAEKDGALVLLFDNGDALQGTPLGDMVAEQPERLHPLMRAFSHLRYDAIGLGNHDFNFGLKSLDTALRQAPCPVLCSNLKRVGQGPPFGFEPFAILDRMVRCGGNEWPIRIGVLSFLPPQTVTWDAGLLKGEVEARAIVASARDWLPDLRAAGCDLVIALAHSGLGEADDHADLENAVLPLAALDGIDAVVSGHTHQHFPGSDHSGLAHVDATKGTVHGKPTVMAGNSGSHLGVIDLDLVARDGNRWTADRFDCGLRPIVRHDKDGKPRELAEEDPEMVQLLSEDHSQTRALMDQPLGHSEVSLHSYFSFIAPDRALAVVAAAQAEALRTHIAGSEAAGLPILSATAPAKFGARAGPGAYTDVPAGPLSLRHVADLHVFPNQLRGLVVTGAQLLDWLEMSASRFHHIEPGGANQALVDTAIPGHDFDVMHGISYEIDLSLPRRFRPNGRLAEATARRVLRATHDGTQIQPEQRFAVALNSFRANGGGPFPMLRDCPEIALPKITLREAITRYVASGTSPAQRPEWSAPWRFSPLPGTVVSVETGPGALAHMEELSHRGITAAGMTSEGFLRLSVPL